MPELPEVETVRLGLQRLLPGRSIVSVDFDTAKSFPNAPHDVEEFLAGATVMRVRRRAKVLMIDLSTEYSLVIHLKMTGQLVFVPAMQVQKESGDSKWGTGKTITQIPNSRAPIPTVPEVRFGAGHPNDSLIGELPDRSTRVIITFEQGKDDGLGTDARKNRGAQQDVLSVHRESTADSDTADDQERWRSFGLSPKAGQSGPQLFFNDQRKFGWMRLMPTVEIPNIDFMKRVGPEPLSDDFTEQVFIDRVMRRKNTSIKAAILDQTVLAGVGNIYADESLFAAKIHPASIVAAIPLTRLRQLHAEIRAVLLLSIEKGGSTDRNYVNAEGKRGSYIDFAKVFRRNNLPCPVCGREIIKIKVAGRGTHVCTRCQKLYKASKK